MAEPLHPRPQFTRARWQSLDGPWDFSTSEVADPDAVEWTGRIEVPYPPESRCSGIHHAGFHPVVWYRRRFSPPSDWQGQRVLLHFGAVDYAATVWVNGRQVARHEGGHTPFHADISEALAGGEHREATVVLRAEDDPHDLHKPRGKQDWQLEPHSIWYPRTSGIWQSVWLEPVPERRVAGLRFTPNLRDFAIRTDVEVTGDVTGLSLEMRLELEGELLAADRWQLVGPRTQRVVQLSDPGIDDARARYLWSPEHPALIDVRLVLKDGEEIVDEVASYTALRSVEIRDGAFCLNARPYFLRLVLDQGYWPESLLAAPGEAALRRDVELAKAMGFNGVRKHQKLEDPRYLYWADRLGLLVWSELPSAYSFSPKAAARLTREWLEALMRDYNHPCIVAWVPFNESWGVPDLAASAAQRHLVQGLYHLAKALDGSRPVVGNDGWEHVVTDLLTIHDYSSDPITLEERYATPEASRATSTQFRPGGRSILLEGAAADTQPVVLSEFGGVRFSGEDQGWGYSQVDSADALLGRYRSLVAAASQRGLAGFCYTQFADTFQEQNGLLYADRRPKVELAALAEATRNGGRPIA